MVQKGVNIGMNHDVRRDGMEELIMQVWSIVRSSNLHYVMDGKDRWNWHKRVANPNWHVETECLVAGRSSCSGRVVSRHFTWWKLQLVQSHDCYASENICQQYVEGNMWLLTLTRKIKMLLQLNVGTAASPLPGLFAASATFWLVFVRSQDSLAL
jgi:hypothetical protein